MNEIRLIVKPDEDELEAAEVYVDGRIGSRSYRFLLDTGAARSAVGFDDYTSTFATAEKHHSSGVFARHSEDLITVPIIEVGPVSRSDFTLVRTGEQNPHVRNLIGMDLLKDFCCHFLFREQRVLLDAHGTSANDAALQDLFLDTKFHPYLDVEVRTTTAKAVWDTGASLTIVDMNFIAQHADHFQAAGQSAGTDSTGSSVETPMFVMSETTLGNHSFPPVRVAGVDLSPVNATIEVPMDMILGYNLLSKANWLFDFPRKQWAITQRIDTE